MKIGDVGKRSGVKGNTWSLVVKRFPRWGSSADRGSVVASLSYYLLLGRPPSTLCVCVGGWLATHYLEKEERGRGPRAEVDQSASRSDYLPGE